MPDIAIRRVAIQPIECYQEAWRRIRDQYWTFFGISVVGILIGSAAPLGVLMGPMRCGIDLCFLQKWRGQAVRFETLFKGFDHFLESFIATLIMLGCGLVIMLPVIVVLLVAGLAGVALAAHTREPGAGVLVVAAYGGAIVLLTLVAALVGTLFAFSFVLIVDKGLRGVEAVKTSALAAWRNIWGMLGLGLLGAFLGLAGACCCYVGALLVLPVSFAAIIAAYDRVFGIAAPAEPASSLPAAG